MPRERAQSAPTVLVLGIGNVLMADEGVGVAVVCELSQEPGWPDSVRFLDGGTQGVRLLPYLEGVDHLIVVDAVRSGNAPGALVRLESPSLIEGPAGSQHDLGVAALLGQAALLGWAPQRLVAIGIEPGRVALIGEAFSAQVRSRLSELKQMVRDEVAAMLRTPTGTPSPQGVLA